MRFYDRDESCYMVCDTDKIAEYCRKEWPEDTKHILRIADDACRGEFLFDLKWDMERTYVPVIFKHGIDWSYMPGDDPEFIFQFNRHRFFICLGQAYCLTGDEKYAQAYTEMLLDWIEKCPVDERSRKTTWRTIEAGLRGEYWTRAFRYFKGSRYITDRVIKAFTCSMKEHAEYLIKEHSVVRRMSNWSILEDHGLFEIGCLLPQNADTKRYIDTALRQLEIECRLQILPDGAQWEQSPMYHNEVYHCLLDVVILADKNMIKLPEAIRQSVKKLAYANLAWVKPDHHQFINGDSDDTDIRDLIGAGAYWFRDGVLKSAAHEKMDFETAWDLGYKAVLEYADIKAEQPDTASRALINSGNYYLRSDWSENANLLHFHCGTLGAGHGHSDQLHVDLVVNGEDVLMDSGRFNYVAGPNRYEFKDPMAHNTVTVDGKLFTICLNSWECSKLSQPINQKHLFLEDYEFLQGGHLGYMDIGVCVNRKLIHIKPDIYIIADEFYTNGKHTYRQYFNFNNLGKVKDDQQRAENVTVKSSRPERVTAYTYKGKKAEVQLTFMATGLKSNIITTRVSRNYNQAEQRPTVVNSFEGNGFTSAYTVIYTGAASENSELSDALRPLTIEKLPVNSSFRKVVHPASWAEALKLTIGEKKDSSKREYVVIICHQEVNTPTDQTEADGCMGFGNVIVFDKGKELQPGTTLLY